MNNYNTIFDSINQYFTYLESANNMGETLHVFNSLNILFNFLFGFLFGGF